MLRPLLALATLVVAVLVLAPTVASLHDGVTRLDIHRDMPWQIWLHPEVPPPVIPTQPDCTPANWHMDVGIIDWPGLVNKNDSFPVHGRVITKERGAGARDITVELFLNRTKIEPGQLFARAKTTDSGNFVTDARIPPGMQASHYHIVAHALDDTKGCQTYHGAWSDPEIDVVSASHVLWTLPTHPVVDQDIDVRGQLVDDAGGAITNANVTIRIAGNLTHVTTDSNGYFLASWHAEKAGNVTVNATYAGNKFYNGTASDATVDVLPEDVALAPSPIELVRSKETTVTGQVFLAKSARNGPVTLTFTGVQVVACDGCAPTSTLQVKTEAGGNFTVNLTAPPPQSGESFTLDITGGGLQQHHVFNGSLVVPVTLQLDAGGNGLFTPGWHATARAVDETGKPAPGNVTFLTPLGWQAPDAAPDGSYHAQGHSACGKRPLEAHYNGTGAFAPQSQSDTVLVCGFLAFLPPWLLAMPWWGWLLVALAALAAWAIGSSLYRKHAPTLSRGPAMTLTLERLPGDDGPGDIVGVGERVRLVAQLPQGLGEGGRLRLGPGRALEWREPADGRASVELEAQERGDWALRAEILDAKGRVVTRRTVTLRVVRYAEEIERRYRALKRTLLMGVRGASSEVVSPREFEAWLREQGVVMDAATAQRLVGLFEEADYSPREAGRSEFLAFLTAELKLGKGGGARAS